MCVHACVYVRATHACMCVICMCACVCVVYMCVEVCMCMRVYVYVGYVCACVCVCVCMWSIYVCVWSVSACMCVCMCMKRNGFRWPAAAEVPLQRLFWGRRASLCAAHRGGGMITRTVLLTCWPGASSWETPAHLHPTPVVASGAASGSRLWGRCLLEPHLLSVCTSLHCLFCSTRFLCLRHPSWPRGTVFCLLNLFVQIPADRIREGTTRSQQPASGVVCERAPFFPGSAQLSSAWAPPLLVARVVMTSLNFLWSNENSGLIFAWGV